ncbi:vacuolar protein sorting-associated [Scheffersomyces coipomensis]|uniref:vacuolar protein sorting-associated n=1 Tax=Scheffersomyces coipomensis TaxID=1788519 RepID=UPI00315D8145
MSGTSSSPLSYAPTATTSYTTSKNHEQYHEEITKSSLLKTSTHKNIYESLAEIYSIIPTLELLENSFLKDFITDREVFTNISYRLINQFQIIVKSFKDNDEKLSLLQEILKSNLTPDTLHSDLSNFLKLFAIKFNLTSNSKAINRLTVGVPATIEHLSTQVESSSHHIPPPVIVASSSGDGSINTTNATSNSTSSARLIAEITGNFITCMDAVKLNYRTKDQLHPLLSDLVVNLNDLIENSNHKVLEFDGKSKLINWLIKVNNLGDVDELNQSDSELFLNDLDAAYKGFYSSLE